MELLPLKTNTLQLLIEKITSYNQGFLGKATASLQQVFKSLISESISMLNEFLPVFKGKKASLRPYQADITALCQCLVTFISRSACDKTLPQTMQQDTI